MKNIKGMATYVINDKTMVVISNEYSGTPLLAYEPDILICTEYILNKYNKELFGYVHKITGKTEIKVIK